MSMINLMKWLIKGLYQPHRGTDQIFHKELEKIATQGMLSEEGREIWQEMATICGLSMAGLFTLLGELGCQHWTLSAKHNSGK